MYEIINHMIAYLRGKVVSAGFDKIIVEVNGVGYGVSLSVRSATQVSSGDQIELHISEVIREQSFDLYGFLTSEEQSLFEILIKVNGVGPRLALAILGIGSGNDIASAVTGGDDRFFSRAPGVGKKLAERLIIELRDKVAGSFYGSLPAQTSGGSPNAMSALMALGFSSDDSRSMLSSVDDSLSVEEQITLALKNK